MRNLATDGEHGLVVLACECCDTADDLAGKTRFIETAFSCHHDIAVRDCLVQTEFISDERKPGYKFCTKRKEPACQPTCRTATLDPCDIDTEAIAIASRGAGKSYGEKLGLCSGGALLRREYVGSIQEQRLHVACHEKLDSLEPRRCADRLHRAETAVGRRRATETHDDPLGPEIERRIDQLPGADR